MNGPLARALNGASLHTVDVAAQLDVDPKTVSRWLAGRVPYPRHRTALVALTGWAERDLWPDLIPPTAPVSAAHEVRVAYPHRSAVPAYTWRRHFAQAECEIGILAYSGLFLAEDAAVLRIMKDKARAGVRVRVALGDPAGRQIAGRGEEEGIGDVMAARIRNALLLYAPVVSEPGIELRLHDTILYSSIYRADNELLVNTHAYGSPASHAPVLHLRRTRDDGVAATYLDSFERVWETADNAYQGGSGVAPYADLPNRVTRQTAPSDESDVTSLTQRERALSAPSTGRPAAPVGGEPPVEPRVTVSGAGP